jgi:anti-sigma28 factor (negative regulator of flagellin synthesis)
MTWMPELGSNGFAEERQEWVNPLETDLSQDKDMVMEQILDNIHHTPLGQVLKKIACLPEVRRKKVLQLRRQITEGKYDVSDRLDMALDKVLEDLIA